MGKEKIFSLLAIVLVLAASASALTQKEEEIFKSLMERADDPAEKEKIVALVEEKNIVFNDPDTNRAYQIMRLETSGKTQIGSTITEDRANSIGLVALAVLVLIVVLMLIYLKIKKKRKNHEKPLKKSGYANYNLQNNKPLWLNEQKIISYIRDARDLGFNEHEIKNELRKVGWSERIIRDSFGKD